jgi:hypothetical protein
MRTAIIILHVFLVLFVNKQASAQIVTDRPDQTESSSTVPKHALQLESGFVMTYEGSDQPSTRQILLPTALFRYGLTNLIELRVLNQIEMMKTGDQRTDGISDMEVGAKVQFLKEDGTKTEMAFLTHLLVPTGTKELTRDKYGTSNKLSISHEINENTRIGYNVGYAYFGEGNGNLIYSLAYGTGISHRAGIYVEPFGEIANMEEFILNLDAGFTCLAKENLQFDISFGTGLNHRMNYVSIGFSWLITDE